MDAECGMRDGKSGCGLRGLWRGWVCLFEENAQPRRELCVSIRAMTNDRRDEMDGMDARDDQALWDLLGRHQPTAKAGPYLSRRVLREVALAEERRAAGWWESLVSRLPRVGFGRRMALCSGVASGVCAALLLVLVHAGRTSGPAVVSARAEDVAVLPVQAAENTPDFSPVSDAPVDGASGTKDQVQDAEVIADLDNALQREESRLWTDDTARF